MINDVDETLANLLRSRLPANFAGTDVDISFATPDDQFPPQGVVPPAIDCFLYDIRENLDLRSNDFQFRRDDDGRSRGTPPPVRVDFSYLITAWPGSGNAMSWVDEHRLLGAVMRVLIRHRSIPEEMLHGELRRQDLPLPVSSLQPGRLQSLGEFWQALGGKPKVALNLTITVSVDAGDESIVPLVTDKTLRFGPVDRTVEPDGVPST